MLLEDSMNEIDKFKSKVTYENKTTFGIVGIVLALFFWAIAHQNIGLMDVLILIFPAIFLIIPNETLKNNKPLAIISIIIIGLLLIVGISRFIVIVTEYLPDTYLFPEGYVAKMFLANIVQLILAFYGLFCAFLLTIQTKPNQKNIISSNNIIKTTNNSNTNDVKFEKYCSNCGQGLFKDAKFCSSCGKQLDD